MRRALLVLALVSMAPSHVGHRYIVVDRIESDRAVLVDDNSNVSEVDANVLPIACRVDGAVLRVDGALQEAVRDRTEETKRIAEATHTLERI